MKLSLTPFKVSLSDEQLSGLRTDLENARIPSPTFESTHAEEFGFGCSHSWLTAAFESWKSFDWRAAEAKINEVEQYTTIIQVEGKDVKLHFAGHFSKDPDAIPLLLLHGWPGSFLEFNSAFKLLKESTSPSFSVIVPSQIGYGFSDDPSLETDTTMELVAQQMDILMRGLGFDAYAVQGGDIGSVICRIMAVNYPSVKAVNLNYMPIAAPMDLGQEMAPLSPVEQENVHKAVVFATTGRGYGMMHGTRPATISFAVQSSPIALLAWLGEKFIAWTDITPPLSEILTITTLWYINSTFPKSIYPYRQLKTGVGAWNQKPELYITQPFGFSSFGKEIASAPKQWIQQTGNLQFYRYHERGGHFAAMERPEQFVEDMRDCFGAIFKK